MRLFALTLGAILFTEFLIFIPSASGLRTQWLTERVSAARIASLALEAAPMREVSDDLAKSLLMNAEVLAVAEIEDDMRFQLLAPKVPIEGPTRAVDLRTSTMIGRSLAALSEYFAPRDEVLIVSADGSAEGRFLEIVLPQAPLKASMIAFAWRITGLSLIIALVAAVLIYAVLDGLVVRPMKRVTISVEQFSKDPGSWTRRLSPTTRRDEIGRAQNALSGMEEAVADAFRQRVHLAELGSAVAKINHDLRNSLASAQLVSDVLAKSEDPRVLRAAPRLERALERAIELATATLDYGKAAPRPPKLQTVTVRTVLMEAADEALNGGNPGITVDVPLGLTLETDPDHLYRIASNLLRNAAEAMSQAGKPDPHIRITAGRGALIFRDNGPGLPEKARDNLFKPFAGSTRTNGTGLGLVIAHELAAALGGELTLLETSDAGTAFRLALPGLPQ
ncbi:MAG: HAMP domain-containing histidine kinase [Hyphomonas sp.]|uniref:sensor histidine kinase n=1 Tax=Hyphomonas sp. TaxID=87 RepID=UPI00180CEB7F|nr:HAMP domain-containing sensor histidine kinase [Hyphomonas sp.]MBA3068413.1 HAMP domain-containing histidine kinase [Hyphomonas sp.]MBU4060719.1 HAMP domain-containing histidine kinase [Alphaproteobacteria bacterium]MBU4164703.1 HAMP domain-containing histidine kinase [Alphaproteobacteria bacterium]MBU4569573.1 HAMP domain-containing histidine kinase [Alphaproteobacteria bacterium]